MSYRFGSFNIRKLNLESNKESRKDFSKIAGIIKKYDFDIIAIQEVFSSLAVDAIIRELGEHSYGFVYDKPRRAINDREGYAFIWNKRSFSLASHGKEFFQNPRILENYRTRKELGQINLARDPFVAWFTPNNLPSCEFCLINTHIIFKVNSLTSMWLRRKEFEVLTQSIYKDLAYRPVVGKELYTILLGDYNLNLRSRYLPEMEIIDDRSKMRVICTVQDEPSTLKDRPKEGEEPSTYYWSNNYDHFSFDVDCFSSSGISVHRINTVLDCKDYIEHHLIISDHVPVRLDIDLKA